MSSILRRSSLSSSNPLFLKQSVGTLLAACLPYDPNCLLLLLTAPPPPFFSPKMPLLIAFAEYRPLGKKLAAGPL
jgi:hypothetical protein